MKFKWNEKHWSWYQSMFDISAGNLNEAKIPIICSLHTRIFSLSLSILTNKSTVSSVDWIFVCMSVERSESRAKFEFVWANKKSLVCKENKAFNWKRLKMVGGILRMFGKKVAFWSRNVWKIETHILPWIIWKSLKKREDAKCVRMCVLRCRKFIAEISIFDIVYALTWLKQLFYPKSSCECRLSRIPYICLLLSSLSLSSCVFFFVKYSVHFSFSRMLEIYWSVK